MKNGNTFWKQLAIVGIMVAIYLGFTIAPKEAYCWITVIGVISAVVTLYDNE